MTGSYVAAALGLLCPDFSGQRVLVHDTPELLTRLAFRLLAELLWGNGRVVSRKELRCTVSAASSALRPPGLLTTEWGVGFRLRAAPAPYPAEARAHTTVTGCRTTASIFSWLVPAPTTCGEAPWGQPVGRDCCPRGIGRTGVDTPPLPQAGVDQEVVSLDEGCPQRRYTGRWYTGHC
ncbi:helix-turn-helix domain-containing protein [Actinacidiphila soli]|uniref:hypothetical protein n=1 Tax=Actinacidiphila soli TaxID=2487275 RepID=UPI0013E3A255|nr:hypothetical protein [Actinacidiphila soli]